MVGRGSGAPGCGAGKWNNFIRPCSMNNRAVMILKVLSTRGDQASRFAWMAPPCEAASLKSVVASARP